MGLNSQGLFLQPKLRSCGVGQHILEMVYGSLVEHNTGKVMGKSQQQLLCNIFDSAVQRKAKHTV